MKKRTKQILLVVFWLVLLAIILFIPQFSFVVAIGLLLAFGYKKTKNIPIVKTKRR